MLSQKRQLRKIVQRQARKGVIKPVRGKHGLKTGFINSRREELNIAVRNAREQKMPGGGVYGTFGHHYGLTETLRVTPSFNNFIENKIRELKRKQKKKPNARLRWLDIGPGNPGKFMTYFKEIDPARNKIDLHTLSPDQVNPKTERTLERKPMQFTRGKGTIARNEPNPGYEPTLQHHVGAVETYNMQRLGRFDVIVSIMGGIYYTKHPSETLRKVSANLAVDGKAFMDFKNENFRKIENVLEKMNREGFETSTIQIGGRRRLLIITRNR
ncbi:MAG: hypothetical protein Q7S92_00480 [Candidatus Diapherotrites archaeon]|nr:hypothetical protein [Candidatus Diapherotrites archaeon]